MRSFLLSILAVPSTLLASPSLAQGVLPYPVNSATLDNGLQVHVVPMRSAPGVVAVYTWMAVGSRDEVDVGRTGFAHFFEHLMFFDTETVDREERERRMLRMGVEGNAWTWLDETVYHGVLPSKHLEAYLELEADRLQNLALTEDDVRREAGAVYGEYRKSVADPDFVLDTRLSETAFTTHTYGHDTIGYVDDIAAMPTAHAYAQSFYSRFYRPGHATVLVVGDVDPAAVHTLVDDAYGTWEPSEEARPELPVEPPQTETRRVHVPWPSPTAARLVMAWKVPAHDPDNPQLAHLQLAADLLLSPVGRLQQRLIREEALAFHVSGGRDDFVDPGLFRVWVQAKSPEHLQAIEAVIREEISSLQSGPASDDLTATRTHDRYHFLTSLDSPARVASTLGWTLRRHPEIDALARWRAHIDEATPDQVAAAAGTWLVDETLTVATLSHEEAP